MNEYNTRRTFLRRMGTAGVAAAIAGPASACASARTSSVEAPSVWPADDDDFWRMVRKQYPLTLERTYFNTGGLGPATYSALDAMRSTQMELARISETGHSKLEAAREAVAEFLGAEATEIAFTRNATEGNATVASGLDLRPGDEVIFESHAHPGGSIPWMVRQKESGVKVRIFEPDPTSAEGNVQRIADLLNDRTRVVQISHITAPTGILLPAEDIATLCHDRGIWFHVDGAQSAGHIPVDLHAIGCDSYATSGHKWIGAPHGTGVLYIRHDRLDEVVPTESGAYSDSGYALPDVFEYAKSAQRYEPGTRDIPSVVGFQAAVGFMTSITMERVAEYSRGLATYLHDALSAIDGVEVLTPKDPALRGAMTTYKVDGVPYDELNRQLGRDYKLRCRIVTERGLDALRISTHIFNNRADCDRLVEGTRAVMGI